MMTMNKLGASLQILILLGGVAICPAAGGEPTTITSAVQLFVDDYLIDTTEGMRRTVHQWRKHPQNPVLRSDKPWENGGNYICTHGSVIHDRQENIFKAWYWTLNDEDSVIPTAKIKSMCYATSTDGIHWKKPNVGLYEFRGRRVERH